MSLLTAIILALSIITSSPMVLSSPAFKNNQPIPAKYTCQGDDISPELTIAQIPPDTKTLCLIVDDPDAPQGTFDHWVVWNIKPNNIIIGEGEKVGVEGLNGVGKKGYHGPCPPPGAMHHYHFKPVIVT